MRVLALLVLLSTQVAAAAIHRDNEVALYVFSGSPCLGVAGAHLTLPNLGLQAVTDSSGYARLAGIPSGQHLLRVVVPGRKQLEGLLTLRPTGRPVAVVADLTRSDLRVVAAEDSGAALLPLQP